MSILLWALSGLTVGLLVSRFAGRYGILEDIIVGVVGAVIGGWLAVLLIQVPVIDPHPGVLIASLGGAFLLLAISRMITGGRTAI